MKIRYTDLAQPLEFATHYSSDPAHTHNFKRSEILHYIFLTFVRSFASLRRAALTCSLRSHFFEDFRLCICIVLGCGQRPLLWNTKNEANRTAEMAEQRKKIGVIRAFLLHLVWLVVLKKYACIYFAVFIIFLFGIFCSFLSVSLSVSPSVSHFMFVFDVHLDHTATKSRSLLLFYIENGETWLL